MIYAPQENSCMRLVWTNITPFSADCQYNLQNFKALFSIFLNDFSCSLPVFYLDLAAVERNMSIGLLARDVQFRILSAKKFYQALNPDKRESGIIVRSAFFGVSEFFLSSVKASKKSKKGVDEFFNLP